MSTPILKRQRCLQLIALVAIPLVAQASVRAEDVTLAELEQQTHQAAVRAVADSVVQIRTVGGLDRLGRTLLSRGPTTGLIVSEDGYIISSAFNFAGQPTSILVRLATGEQLAAELIARDLSRMLVLLKVAAAEPLPVPVAAAAEQIQVGQWAVAVGRTFQAEQVSMSVGIVSALKRMYGRVIQTDANVSVANYGGPLVDISGRVYGILVPMSPQASGGRAGSELAGAEFYDSGIGFAVPLEHVLGMLDRLAEGEDLLPGKLGIGLASGDAHITPAKITSVWPQSPAAIAGWKPDDLIVEVNGQPVSTQAQLRFEIIPHYAGDTVSVTLRRDQEELRTDVTLTGKLAPYRHAFLGLLPDRSGGKGASMGAIVRDVWPGSPAAQAGVEAGDRITKMNEKPIESTADALNVLVGMHPKETVTLVVVRDEEELTPAATLSRTPTDLLPAAAIDWSTTDQELLQGDETAQLEILKLPDYSQEAVYFLPTVEKDQQLGLLLWLGDGEAESNQALVDDWQLNCRRDGVVLLIAPPEDSGNWKSDDLSYVQHLTRAALRLLPIDRRRLVVSGQGKAGQLAFAVALKRRSGFGGVVAIDAPLPRTLKLRGVSPSDRLAVLSVEARDSNFAPLIRRDLKNLRAAGYPASWLERPPLRDGSVDLDDATRDSIARWIDTIDRY